MMYSNIPNPPAKFTATMYGKTVTIELDHSDFDLSELMEIFKGLAIASGFEMSSWNNVIKSLSADIHDYEREDLKEKLNEWKNEEDEDEFKDLRHNTPKDGLDEWKARNGFGSWTADSEGHEFKEWGDEDDETIEEEIDWIAQEQNEGQKAISYEEWHRNRDKMAESTYRATKEDEDEFSNDGGFDGKPHYEWNDNIKGYEYESNSILTNINDSIIIIKDRMEDIDIRMDNIDEQLGILNADVANIEFNIQHPIVETLLNAKEVYDKSVIETKRFNKVRKDIVDMKNGEVTYDEDGGFAVKMNKSKVTKGKIKDLKK